MSDTIALPLNRAEHATLLAALLFYRAAGGFPALGADLKPIAKITGHALGAAAIDTLVTNMAAAGAALAFADAPAANAACDTPALPLADQSVALSRGWCLLANDAGQMTIEARALNRRFLTDAAAYDHVAAVAEAVSYADADYQALCQRALALADDAALHSSEA
jgi:hypothetical protein